MYNQNNFKLESIEILPRLQKKTNMCETCISDKCETYKRSFTI